MIVPPEIKLKRITKIRKYSDLILNCFEVQFGHEQQLFITIGRKFKPNKKSNYRKIFCWKFSSQLLNLKKHANINLKELISCFSKV